MIKEAFFSGFFKRRDERKKQEAHAGFHHALDGVHSIHPLPPKTVELWGKDLPSKGGFHEGYNHFSDKFNSWLPTTEGKKWNAAQAKKFIKAEGKSWKIDGHNLREDHVLYKGRRER